MPQNNPVDSKKSNIIDFKYPTALRVFFSFTDVKGRNEGNDVLSFPKQEKAENFLHHFLLKTDVTLGGLLQNIARWGEAALEEETVDVKSHALQMDEVQLQCSCGRWPETDFGQCEGC